jgi:hypothetical protein
MTEGREMSLIDYRCRTQRLAELAFANILYRLKYRLGYQSVMLNTMPIMDFIKIT